jgi:hypothetical protein
MSEAVLLAALGIVSTCVVGLIWVIKRMFNDIVPALKGLQKATEQNTAATKSADTYLQERNGRDNEHHAAVLKSINAIPETMETIANAQSEAIINAVNIQKQDVKDQVVRHQHIEEIVKEK